MLSTVFIFLAELYAIFLVISIIMSIIDSISRAIPRNTGDLLWFLVLVILLAILLNLVGSNSPTLGSIPKSPIEYNLS